MKQSLIIYEAKTCMNKHCNNIAMIRWKNLNFNPDLIRESKKGLCLTCQKILHPPKLKDNFKTKQNKLNQYI